MKIQVWYNVNKRMYEACPLTRGRPLKRNAKERVSRRLIVEGSTKEQAIAKLRKALKTREVVVV